MEEVATTHRRAFLRAHLYAVAQALAEGVPVLGYFQWSLIDNFEWTDGFEPRFGNLVRVPVLRNFITSPSRGND